MRLSFFALIFFAYYLPAIAQEYYGIVFNHGEISEAANDLVLYFDDGKVIGHLRNYSNQYGNTYSYFYGEGTPEDTTLTLQNIFWLEGSLIEIPSIKLEFIGNRLTNVEIRSSTEYLFTR